MIQQQHTDVDVVDARLHEQESVIQRSFVEAGNALRKIRDEKLYQNHYGTFEEYCRDRWGWERRHAYRQIEAAETADTVSNWSHPITHESHARELTSLAKTDPEAAREAWSNANDSARAEERRVTARDVKEAVRARQGPPRVYQTGRAQEVHRRSRWQRVEAEKTPPSLESVLGGRRSWRR